MHDPDWLRNTSTSYDTVAESYARYTRDALAGDPLVRGVLNLFADLVTTGPVVDVGCGPGFTTAHLRDRGLESFGIDLSPAKVGIARREHPGLGFEVGSMTDLRLPDSSVGGVLAFFSVIHVPDADVPGVLAHFHRVLRPGGVALLGFHVGDRDHLKTTGYGGHPMLVHVHRRPVERVSAWLRAAGFTIAAQALLDPEAEVPAGVLVARRPAESGAPARLSGTREAEAPPTLG